MLWRMVSRRLKASRPAKSGNVPAKRRDEGEECAVDEAERPPHPFVGPSHNEDHNPHDDVKDLVPGLWTVAVLEIV
jgi:hypothetical protein